MAWSTFTKGGKHLNGLICQRARQTPIKTGSPSHKCCLTSSPLLHINSSKHLQGRSHNVRTDARAYNLPAKAGVVQPLPHSIQSVNCLANVMITVRTSKKILATLLTYNHGKLPCSLQMLYIFDMCAL